MLIDVKNILHYELFLESFAKPKFVSYIPYQPSDQDYIY